MNPNDRKQRRRALTRCFFFHNRTAAFLAMSAVILNIPLNLAVAWQMQQLIDIAAGSPSAFTLPKISASLALFFAVMAAIMALGSYARPLFIERAVRQYRDYTFEQLTRKSTAAFHTENTSAYLSALTNDTISIETNYLPALFTLPGNLLLLIGSFALMLYYSIPLTLAAAAAALLPLAASLMAGSRLSCQEKKVSDQNESFMAALQDMLSGFPVIKSFKAQPGGCPAFFPPQRCQPEKQMQRQPDKNHPAEYLCCRRTAGIISRFYAGCTSRNKGIWRHRRCGFSIRTVNGYRGILHITASSNLGKPPFCQYSD